MVKNNLPELDLDTKEIRDSIIKLIIYVESNGYYGFDPYDGLNSKYFKGIQNKAVRYVIMQANKEFPFNIRSFLGIRKGLDIKGLGLFSQSFFTLSEINSFKNSKTFFQLRGEKILDYLLDNSLIDSLGEHCWSGHYFETQGKTGSLSPKKPEIVSTTVCAEAFYKHYELTKSKKSLDVVKSVASFLKKYLIHEFNGKKYFSYYPVKSNKVFVYNATSLGISFLSRISKNHSIQVPLTELMDNIISFQKETGEWNYSLDLETLTERKQIDFHQGYILDSLHDFINFTKPLKNKYFDSLKRGSIFYKEEQFNDNGSSLWRYPGIWPVDIHNQAQGILTFSKLSNYDVSYLDFSKKIAKWTIANMQDKKGFFYYQKGRLLTNKISYMRWSQAWMLLAMAKLLKISENK